MDYKFQVNLRGIIELLSKHLYSGPHVFIRELLQNAVDAIRARGYLEPGYQGEVRIEVCEHRKSMPPTLVFMDNGIGLTMAEVHQFLATIGETSKRSELWQQRVDFIGQFGIGLLSCFVVSDEIVVLTRSVRAGEAPVEWRGRPDGTYSVKAIDRDLPVGTQVYLKSNNSSEELFDRARVLELAADFGGLLPCPIILTAGRRSERVNEGEPPWSKKYASARQRDRALLAYGEKTFRMGFLDWVPLRSETGDVKGAAFVLSEPQSPAAKRTHRVYLKQMLLANDAESLLPDWAFFVKCVVNANELSPNASREALFEDEALIEAREALGICLRDFLVDLVQSDPKRLAHLIAVHHLSFKALAVHDDEFFRAFIDCLPFETSLGTMTLDQYRKRHKVVHYVRTVDEFRQVARVATAQSMCIINGGYTYDADLLEKLGEVFPKRRVEVLDAATIAEAFEELSLEERECAFEFLRTADVCLQPFHCMAEIKKFLPADVPALYTMNSDGAYLRSVEQTTEEADPLWSSLLGGMAQERAASSYSCLCFNSRCPLVKELLQMKDLTLMRRAIEMLYIHSLLLGHHSLTGKEMKLLNDGLLSLIRRDVGTKV